MVVISVLSVLGAIAATVLALIFIVPEKKANRLGSFGKLIHDIANFKFLIIEKVLQASYIFATAAVVLMGFFMLFYIEPGYSSRYYSYPATWYGGYGILFMLLGPIAVRLAYEVIMMFILLVKNVIQINNKMANASGKDVKDIFDEKPAFVEPVAAAQQVVVNPTVCPTCGASIGNEAFCAQCGTKLK